MLIHHILFVLTTIVVLSEASRILAIFPTPSISHQIVFRPLILDLVKRGHEVIMLTTDPIFKKGDGPANLTEIDVHDLSYTIHKEELLLADVTKGSKEDLQAQMEAIFLLMQKVFEQQILTNEVQSLIKDKTKTFDLLMLEAYFSPLLAFSHVYKNVPVIQVSSLGSLVDNLKIVGSPMHPLIYPTCISQRVFKRTLWDKLTVLYDFYKMENSMERSEQDSNQILRKLFGKDCPDISELKKNVDMLFLNVHPVWEMNRPVPPNVIFMGGLHQKPEKELPQVCNISYIKLITF